MHDCASEVRIIAVRAHTHNKLSSALGYVSDALIPSMHWSLIPKSHWDLALQTGYYLQPRHCSRPEKQHSPTKLSGLPLA